MVDFPHPDGPQKAILLPAWILNDTLSKTILVRVGYTKVTFLNSMFPII